MRHSRQTLCPLLKLASALRGTNDYELVVEIRWQGSGDPLTFKQGRNNDLFLRRGAEDLPIASFSPVETTIRPDTDDNDYLIQVRELATGLVNQAGFQHVLLLEDGDPR